MIAKSVQSERRRRIAQLLVEGSSVNEIAKALKIRWDVADADVKAIVADPNNIDYLSPKRALGRLLDAYDTLEREAREHLKLAIDQGKLDAANRWFESIRRITEDRGRVLSSIGVLNRAAEQGAADAPEPPGDELSARAQKLIARIALAERLGRTWDADVRIEDPTALDPIPDPAPDPTAAPEFADPEEGD